jgi:hypothetical protein
MQVDTSKIRALYKKDQVARSVFDYFARRTNDATETKVDRILSILKKEGNDLSRGQIIEFFKVLETLGAGKFVTGRRGWPSRFVWDVGLVSLAKIAGGESQELQNKAAASLADEEGETLSHIFHLRPDLQIKIELPADLTVSEASRLSDFVKSLPFDEDLE